MEEIDGFNNNGARAKNKWLDVCMRVPLLLLLDSVLLEYSKPSLVPTEPTDTQETGDDYSMYGIPYGQALIKIFWAAILHSSTTDLKNIYTDLARVLAANFLVYSSYLLSTSLIDNNSVFVETLTFSYYLTDSPVFRLVEKIIIQGSIAVIFDCCIPRNFFRGYISFEDQLRRTVFSAMVAPCILKLLGFSSSNLAVINYLSVVPAGLLLLGFYFISIIVLFNKDILRAENFAFVEAFGVYQFLENEWSRIRLPLLLRCYWCFRLLIVVYQSWNELHLAGLYADPTLLYADPTLFYADVELVLVRGCETYVALLGMTSVISYLSNRIGIVFQRILDCDEEDQTAVGNISAVLFLILALQTGLVDLQPDKRFFQLCKNSCLLLTAQLHCIHTMVKHTMKSLANGYKPTQKHARALMVCLFLTLFPIGLTYILWNRFTVGTWLLAVTAFCIEAVTKVLVTLTIYGLTMWDIYCRGKTWESFDDCIYWISAFGNCVQFLFAVFLFLNGGWVLLFESGGSFRAVMMVIHAYYNIWVEAKNGWRSFSKRRSALQKVASLADATPADILKHQDVCPICYQEMAQAKLTRCGHMFHISCITKWLYIQDSCPMCQQQLLKVDATSQTEDRERVPQPPLGEQERVPQPPLGEQERVPQPPEMDEVHLPLIGDFVEPADFLNLADHA